MNFNVQISVILLSVINIFCKHAKFGRVNAKFEVICYVYVFHEPLLNGMGRLNSFNVFHKL